MSSINRNSTDGLDTLITVNIIAKTVDELRVLMLLRWIGRDVSWTCVLQSLYRSACHRGCFRLGAIRR
jgi:hypothetical protein